jgi:uncharacterized membrane protein YkvI
MRCFNHQTLDAIGSCKSCCKGLCGSCANDLGHGLACRGVHESEVENIHKLLVRSARVQQMTPKTQYVAPMFAMVMGVLFSAFGFLGMTRPIWFLVALGAAFVVYGLVILLINRNAFREQR